MQEYFDSLHSSAFRLLKESLEREGWNRLPIELDEEGGVTEIVMQRWMPEMTNMSQSQWLQRWHVRQDSNRGNTLQAFALVGNPFSARFAGEESGKKVATAVSRRLSTIVSQDAADDEGADGVRRRLKLGENGDAAKASEGKGAADGDSEEEEEEEAEDDFDWAEMRKSTAVTSTALNAFAKYAGKYIQIMELLPMVAGEAFAGLAQLFDFYFYTVFSNFANPEVQAALLNPRAIEGLGVGSITRWELLRKELNRIRTSLGIEMPEHPDEKPAKGKKGKAAEAKSSKRHLQRLSSMIDLTSKDGLFALASRAVAGDSLIFLVQVRTGMAPTDRVPCELALG